MINIKKMRSFIDNVMAGMENEEEHDKLKILRRMEKNDLYVKPEKYKWKVKEVDCLRVVIGPEEIKMEKRKSESGVGLASS